MQYRVVDHNLGMQRLGRDWRQTGQFVIRRTTDLPAEGHCAIYKGYRLPFGLCILYIPIAVIRAELLPVSFGHRSAI
jgi:hypothetical protein